MPCLCWAVVFWPLPWLGAGQVGKGRDVGLNQISLFEAKVASGNGEQVLSRDVFRLGRGLDLFRSLSFYHTSVGFFVATALTALSTYLFLYGRCFLALSGIEASVGSTAWGQALLSSINQQLLVQVTLSPCCANPAAYLSPCPAPTLGLEGWDWPAVLCLGASHVPCLNASRV